MGYFKDTVKGISWTGTFRAVNRGIVFVKTAILARLLTPKQFGVFGIATLALAFLEVLTETGINVVLVQEKSDIDEYINTAFIVSLIRGLLISLLIFFSAPYLVRFFNSPDSYECLILISLVPFLRGFINPSVVKFQKDLLFNKEFWYRSAILIVDTVFAVTLSFITHSPLALVWGLIAGVFVEVGLSYLVVSPKPKFLFDVQKIKRVVGRGKWVTAYGIFNYLFQNGDNMVVGKALGTGDLGLYSVAYKISSLPISEISDIFAKVTFPVYVKISDDKKRLFRAYIKTTLSSGLLITILGAGIYLFSKEIVYILLGPSWLAAVPVLKILSIFGVIKGISGTALSLFLAIGKQEYVMVVTLVGILGLAIPIIPLTLRFGLIGTGIAVIIGSLVTLPVIVYYNFKIFKWPK